MSAALGSMGAVRYANLPPQILCIVCRVAFDESAWQALDLAERIEASEVSRFVRGWSPNECIEVRHCRTCRKPIAARRTLAPTKTEDGRRSGPGAVGVTPRSHRR